MPTRVIPANSVVTNSEGMHKISNLQLEDDSGSIAEAKPRRLVQRGTASDQVKVAQDGTKAIAAIGFEDTPADLQPEQGILFAYKVGDRPALHGGNGEVVLEATAAVGLDAKVKTDADGKVQPWVAGTDTADEIVGEAKTLTRGGGGFLIVALELGQ